MFRDRHGEEHDAVDGLRTVAEPIAIVGIGCRFPGGANDPETFWELLTAGRNAVTEIPADRWSIERFYDRRPGIPGRTNSRWGGFIAGVDQFDAGFFGIAPREAARMDPQQRVLLEVAWETLEDAGVDVRRLAGSPVGVYVGMSSLDYMLLMNSSGEVTAIDAHSNTGGAMSIAANRLSYFLDLRGPSVAMDTACSSSLAAVHAACEAMRRGDVSAALAGGVNILLKPEPFIGFSRASMLAPDGRCKAFDARADGFVRGEGAGLVFLRPLSAALRDGDRIYALIHGMAVNQDGRTKGMTVPNEEAQLALVREACRRSGIHPHDLRYVEAHGTGTPVGDPIEARALGRARQYEGGNGASGAAQSDGHPLIIGSVKTNIGHLEPAAGAAGLIKTALALAHRTIPASLHFESPNPDVPFAELGLRVATQLEPWPTPSGPAWAGVNSFGFGGTNAHAVLSSVDGAVTNSADCGLRIADSPCEAPAADSAARPEVLVLSARSAEALRALAERWKQELSPGGRLADRSLRDIAWSAAVRRTPHGERLALVARTHAEAVELLAAYLENNRRPEVVQNRASPTPPKLAWVCCGQGPQWWGMGRQLLREEPVFRETIERIDAVIRAEGDWSLLEQMRCDESASRMHDTTVAQPAIFAVQAGLAALYESWGIRPDAVAGHSVGEAAAALIAGVFDLETATRVIFHRARSMAAARCGGAMLAAALSADEAAAEMRAYNGAVTLAAVNAPNSVTLSGDCEALADLARRLEERKIFCRMLRVSHAFHSAHMDPAEAELRVALANLAPRRANIPLVSSVTGTLVDGTGLDADYWWRNIRLHVRFADAVRNLSELGCTAFLEIGPHPVLKSAISECLESSRTPGLLVHALQRDRDDQVTSRAAIAGLHAGGYPIDWERFFGGRGRYVSLPRYPWQHEHFWSEDETARSKRLGPAGHPLIGVRTRAATPTWEHRIDARVQTHLRDHRVQGQVILPGVAYLEMALAAARELGGGPVFAIEEVEYLHAGFLEPERGRDILLTFDEAEARFEVVAAPATPQGSEWTTLAAGRVRTVSAPAGETPVDLAALRGRLTTERTGEQCYQRMAAVGLEYGPAYRGVQRLWSGAGEALGEIAATDGAKEEWSGYYWHPALLDACIQTIAGVSSDGATSMRGFMPTQIGRVRVRGPAPERVWSHARIVSVGGREIVADVTVYDDAGKTLVEIEGLRARALDDLDGGDGSVDSLIYEYAWYVQGLRPGRAPAEQPQSGQDGVPKEPRRPFAVVVPAPTWDFADVERAVQDCRRATSAAEWERRLVASAGEMNALCAAYIVRGLRDLGWRPQLGQRVTALELRKSLAIADRFDRLLARYLEILAEDGYLAPATGEGGAGARTWAIVKEPPQPAPDRLWREMLSRFPSLVAELTLLANCGEQLPAILRGEQDPLMAIFPEGSMATAEHVYQDAPSTRHENAMAAAALAGLAQRLPEGRTLRVLEIGAGTGGTTAHALPRLAATPIRYVFTDLSKRFLNRAEQRFGKNGSVEYRIFDVEKDPIEQGFEPGAFDVILAAQVLHATRDMRQTLTHARRLLAPGGVLLLIEGLRRHRWADTIFGLTEGWWRFGDLDLRQDHPLVSLDGWRKLLAETGFIEVAELSGRTDPPNGIILARGPQAIDTNAPPMDCTGQWLILADRHGIARRLAERLTAGGGNVRLVEAGEAALDANGAPLRVMPGSVEQMEALIRRFGGGCRGIIHAWACDAPDSERLDVAGLQVAQRDGCLTLVQLCQAIGRQPWKEWPRLFVVTRGAQHVRETAEPAVLAQTPVLGLSRVVVNEYPQLRPAMVDLSASPDDAEIAQLLAEVVGDDREDEIALRGGERFVRRFERRRTRTERTPADAGSRQPFRYEVVRPGVFERLTPRPLTRRPPEARQVEIEVHAAGLNFADVMKVLGIYPGLAAGPIPLGFECSGRIARVGPGVTTFREGDEVYGIAPLSIGSHALTGADLIAKKPADLTHEEAATIPIAFLTAYYALIHLGHLEAGERALIHAATGGVGLAALQIVERCKAESLATAGSPQKRDLLRRLGVPCVMDSRSTAFVEQTRAYTNGEGVDVVLNSLAGAGLVQSFGLLRNYGRFLEIGKRDIYANRRLGMAPFRRNASFFAVDLDLGMRERRELCARLFQEVAARVAKGEYRPLPHRTFAIGDVVGALRHMSQARHVGKVVIAVAGQPVPAVEPPTPTLTLREDATYLISGGLGGLGLATAGWMIDRGARHVVLMGRRGIHSAEIAAAVESLRAKGAEVVVETADVCRGEDVAAVLGRIAANMPPLRGVLHGAMVLDDCLIHNLTPERLASVTAPKVLGAWHLHRQTEKLPLDFFLMFSSMASVFGIGGQANYAAANAFLDALAHYRRSRGMPATTINWGSIAQIGYVAQRPEIIERFSREGVAGLSPEQAFAAIERLIAEEAPQAGVVRFDWSRWRGFSQTDQIPPRFEALQRFAVRGEQAASADAGSARRKLAAAAPAARRGVLIELLGAQVARVLGASADKLDTRKPLTEMGLDSLMGVEIRNWVEGELGVSVPTVELMRGPSVEQLADSLLERLGGPAAPPSAPQPVAEPPATPAAPAGEDGERRMELSFAQRRLWALTRLAPAASPAMNNIRAARLYGELNVERLEQAANLLVRRHDALRTSIVEVDGAPYQQVAADVRLSVKVVDLTARPESERETAARRIAAQEAARPFDLAVAPLVRFMLLRLREKESIAVIVMHHVAGDGWSSGVLLYEFLTAYGALARGQTPSLPPLRRQYGDFVRRQRELLAGPRGRELREHWRSKLNGGIEAPRLPRRLAANAGTAESLAGATRRFQLENAAALRKLAQSEGCTLYVVLLSAFVTVLSRYSGESEITVGTPQANREGDEWANVVGFLANTLPVRVDVGDAPTFRRLMATVRSAVLDAQEHQELPVEVLLEEGRSPQSGAAGDLFGVVFTLLNVPMPVLELPGLKLAPETIDAGVAGYDVSLVMAERDGVIEGELMYRLAIFDETAADQFVEDFRAVLASALADSSRPISRESASAARAGH